jgi:hypothetical protein
MPALTTVHMAVHRWELVGMVTLWPKLALINIGYILTLLRCSEMHGKISTGAQQQRRCTAASWSAAEMVAGLPANVGSMAEEAGGVGARGADREPAG